MGEGAAAEAGRWQPLPPISEHQSPLASSPCGWIWSCKFARKQAVRITTKGDEHTGNKRRREGLMKKAIRTIEADQLAGILGLKPIGPLAPILESG